VYLDLQQARAQLGAYAATDLFNANKLKENDKRP
jgi:hypothetical protein